MAERGARRPAAARSSWPPLAQLRAFHGEPSPPPTRDPFALVLWEAVAYLVDDEKRAAAFAELKKRTRLEPRRVMTAAFADLHAATSLGGIHAEDRAERVREIGRMTVEEFGGDLAKNVLSLPFERARRLLARFPGIGEPGAEKVLLFTGTYPVLALESNGLRVLLRLGYGEEDKNYGKSYRSAQAAVRALQPPDCDGLLAAHQLLRHHGQVVCKRSQPRCEACPVSADCAWYRRTSPG